MFDFFKNRYFWPNGNATLYEELAEMLKEFFGEKGSDSSCIQLVKLTFWCNMEHVLNHVLHRENSVEKRREFYAYINLLFPYKPDNLDNPNDEVSLE